MRKIIMLLACAMILAPNASQAQQLIESYQAFLSEQDHFNSNGQRLMSAAAIIRQDRANYHRYGIRDADDESDSFFADVGNRSSLERLIERGRAGPGVISQIVNGTPTVRVEVWRGSFGPYINVTIAQPQAQRQVVQPTPPPMNSDPFKGVAPAPLPKATPPIVTMAGLWSGTYSYANGNKVGFSFTFDPQCRGRSEEVNTFGQKDAPKLFANLKCNVTQLLPGQAVEITKTYDGTGGVSHAAYYTGVVSNDADEISGQWAVGANRGTFTLRRK